MSLFNALGFQWDRSAMPDVVPMNSMPAAVAEL